MSHNRCCCNNGVGFGGSWIWILILILIFCNGGISGCSGRRRCC